MRRILLFLLSLSIFSCQNGDTSQNKPTSSFEKLIVGTWEHREMFLQVNNYEQSDSTFTLDVRAGEWPEKLNVERILTEYRPDHTYRMYFYGLEGDLEKTVRGVWNNFGDSTLLHIEPDGTYEYRLGQKGKDWILENTLDWDGDQEVDDDYRLVLSPAKK